MNLNKNNSSYPVLKSNDRPLSNAIIILLIIICVGYGTYYVINEDGLFEDKMYVVDEEEKDLYDDFEKIEKEEESSLEEDVKPDDEYQKEEEIVETIPPKKEENEKIDTNNNDKPVSNVSRGQKEALSTAKVHLHLFAMSKQGLKEQLEFEGYKADEVEYALNNCGANWNEQAYLKAKSYLELSSFDKERLTQQLTFEGFTKEQILYALNKIGL